jgi:regulator of RNase E activity RraA
MVGYAATATCCAREPPRPDEKLDMNAYYEHVLAQPKPRVLVAQDLDNPPLGALFGEVNASIHKALGCVGHVTNGGVRDLDECHRIGFQYFSGCVQVSHAYVRIVDFGEPVKMGGVTVHSGDLIHADRHGVCLIPKSVASELALACRAMEALERPLIELARSKEFTPARLVAARATMREGFERESKRFSKG